jgi:RNA polymerase primary sigma factor
MSTRKRARVSFVAPRRRSAQRDEKSEVRESSGGRRGSDLPEGMTPEDEEDVDVVEEEETSTAKQSEPTENFLARYFKEMAELSVLKPEEEFEAARHIEALEHDLWAFVLNYPQLVDAICFVIESELEEPPAKELSSLKRSSKNLKARPSAAARKRFQSLCEATARQIHEADMDRIALFAVLQELKHIARGDMDTRYTGKVSVSIRSKAFTNYSRQVRHKFKLAQVARNSFVKSNLRLVVSIARRFNHGRMPLSDLIQEGNIGLIKAVERYDYRRGFRFSTYASWWIRHAISRALADKGRAVRLPVHMIDAYHKVAKTRRELSNRLGRQPTSEEVASESGIAIEKVRKLEGYLMEQAVSLDREVSDDDGRRFVDFIEDTEAALPSERVMNESLNEQVMELIGELKPIESDILRKRFGLVGGREQTLKEIGEDYNLSRERIRQLQEQALGKIRRALRRQDAI